MKPHRPTRGRSASVIAIATLLAMTALVALTNPVMAVRPNAGTIKVHDNATADPEQANEPHVSCDFWVEGFGMEGANGDLVFVTMPPPNPPAPGSPATATGAASTWTANGDGDFLSGAFQLPVGHYKVTADSVDDKDKSKVFWVDACQPPTTTTEIPVFPTALSLVLGTLGALGGALLVLRRKA